MRENLRELVILKDVTKIHFSLTQNFPSPHTRVCHCAGDAISKLLILKMTLLFEGLKSKICSLIAMGYLSNF